MKKILLTILNINNSAGTERAVVNLANLLSEHYNVSILSLIKDYRPDMFYKVNDKVIVEYANLDTIPKSPLHKIIWFYKSYKFLKRFIIANKFDITIGTGHNINAILALLNRSKKYSRMIACEHVDFSSTPFLSRMIMKLVYSSLNAVVFLSKQARDKFIGANQNTFIIPNSLSFSGKQISSLESTRILMIGRLVPGKRYDRVIPLAKYLKKYHSEWLIDIIGDGNLSLEDKFIYEQLSNVNFLGAKKDVFMEYLKSSIYLSTSDSEAMPMVFIEAMNCGIPIVSYRHQGSECLIEQGKNGFIVDTDEEMIEKVSLLIQDYELRKIMGKDAKLYSNKFSDEKIYEKWKSLFDSI